MATINAVNTSLSGQTGTNKFVGSTAPLFDDFQQFTGNAGQQIKDVNGAVVFGYIGVASGVNSIYALNAIAGASPALVAQGSDANIIALLQGKGNAGCGIQGCSTNSAAAAGYVGQIISNSAGPVAMTSTIQVNVTSISLTAGDWVVNSAVIFVPTGTITVIAAGLNTVSATLGGLNSYSVIQGFNMINSQGFACPLLSVSVAATTTLYLVAQSTFTATQGVYGNIVARRVR